MRKLKDKLFVVVDRSPGAARSLNACIMYNNILLSYPEDCFKEATLSCFIYDLSQLNQFGRHDCISFGRFTLMAGLFLLHMFTKSIDLMN